jgi:hypothetical protein
MKRTASYKEVKAAVREAITVLRRTDWEDDIAIRAQWILEKGERGVAGYEGWLDWLVGYAVCSLRHLMKGGCGDHRRTHARKK